MTFMRLVILFVFAEVSFPSPSPTSYSAALVRYLLDHHHGSFDCWFYQLTNIPYENNTLDELISRKELDHIPKRVLYHANEVQFSPQLELMIIFCDSWTQTLLQFLYNLLLKLPFKPSFKIIVLYQHLTVNELMLIQTAFTYSNALNTVFIRSDRLEVHYFLVYKNQMVQSTTAVPFKELFNDQTNNLVGHQVHLSFGFNNHETLVLTKDRLFRGRIYEWILCTIQKANGSSKLHVVKDSKDWYVRTPTDNFDFFLNFITFQNTRESFITSPYPDKLLVAVPAGRRYEVHEVFAMPFEPEVWILIIALTVVSHAVSLLFPNLFQNDIIDTAVCGFERRNLHSASKLEKFIILPLVAFNFFLFSAYEAKIITFITNAPYAACPRTFEDLLQAGITINVSTEHMLGMAGDPRFKLVFKYSPAIPVMTFRRKVGYCASSHEILQGILDPENYDVVTKRSKMVILDQFSMGNFVKFFFVGLRNPLEDKLLRTELLLYEAGLMEFWSQRMFRDYYGIKYAGIVADVNGPDDESLGMMQLRLIFVGLFIGFGLATLVFVGEMCISRTLKSAVLSN